MQSASESTGLYHEEQERDSVIPRLTCVNTQVTSP
jgi:hypothetical protein